MNVCSSCHSTALLQSGRLNTAAGGGGDMVSISQHDSSGSAQHFPRHSIRTSGRYAVVESTHARSALKSPLRRQTGLSVDRDVASLTGRHPIGVMEARTHTVVRIRANLVYGNSNATVGKLNPATGESPNTRPKP